ncbi:MAG: S1 RNA-binding domain-containing protein [Lachnospiraceae bacterium]|nr:S1 RNA-binding domain-containing protein [Lachnospiraceae bacterium]
MLLLGKTQILVADHFADAGVYLRESGGRETVLLPQKQVPEGTREGDLLQVFLYKDSEDRPIATTLKPALELGGLALLKVKALSNIGAFLDWGLPKDLFLPFKETAGELKAGQEILVTLYLDKSGRLAASMRIDKLLQSDSPYEKDDKVKGTVYALSREIGAFVAVDDKYFGLIPRQELYENLKPGDTVDARVIRKRPDGKLNLSPRKKAYAQIDPDGKTILEHLQAAGGILGIGDKSDAAMIQTELSMSKNAFKRAAGHLLKAGKIKIFDDHLEIMEDSGENLFSKNS